MQKDCHRKKWKRLLFLHFFFSLTNVKSKKNSNGHIKKKLNQKNIATYLSIDLHNLKNNNLAQRVYVFCRFIKPKMMDAVLSLWRNIFETFRNEYEWTFLNKYFFLNECTIQTRLKINAFIEKASINISFLFEHCGKSIILYQNWKKANNQDFVD